MEPYLNDSDAKIKCVRMLFFFNVKLKQLLDLFGVHNVKELSEAIVKQWDELDYKKALKGTNAYLFEEQVVSVLDKFTIETNRDRIIFVTKDHPFYGKGQKDKPVQKLLTKLTSAHAATSQR